MVNGTVREWPPTLQWPFIEALAIERRIELHVDVAANSSVAFH